MVLRRRIHSSRCLIHPIMQRMRRLDDEAPAKATRQRVSRSYGWMGVDGHVRACGWVGVCVYVSFPVQYIRVWRESNNTERGTYLGASMLT